MKRFKDILVAVDTQLEEHPAMQWAVRLVEHNQAKLKIVDVMPEFSWIARLAMPDGDGAQQVLPPMCVDSRRCTLNYETAEPTAGNRVSSIVSE